MEINHAKENTAKIRNFNLTYVFYLIKFQLWFGAPSYVPDAHFKNIVKVASSMVYMLKKKYVTIKLKLVQ